ncbi:sodium:solute symporter family protein [Emticicia sp. BO119]|uniref:sodium:solute symporter family protein n=1 Tax=Emticicia sp. BO119 TaxID=2757768 RepID=UPI0015F08F73|nr:sodium:solute symporter family protein [Emticicia sp. BO119]MBA4849979.1 Na+:solute symporter [Emticicia sp. BO119]
MKIHLLDGLVILAYLLIVSSIGFIMRKRAKKSKNEYLLGGNSLPWWMLGISNASGMFDISGTLWMVSIMFIYGVKSIWLPWLWPVFNQVFMFVYLSVWLRRSNASTGAEWMLTRFGSGPDAMRSHKIIIAFALLSCLGFMAYGFIGLGKFIEIFIPIEAIQPFLPFIVPASFTAHFYGIIFTLFAVLYSIMGGMSSIVWADVVQYFLMALGSVSIAIIAMIELGDHSLPVPDGWFDLSFGWNLGIDWSNMIPEVNAKIKEDNFNPFGVFFSLMTAKGILASLAGPAPNYDMQKILSTKSPREAALMNMFVNVILLPTRYLMIISFTVLGLIYFKDLNIQTGAGSLDFERILPASILKFAPAGLMGLFLVELMAAFMGTFAGTLNAAQAYIVNDIYLKSIKPKASNNEINQMNYLSGIVVVVISIVIGIFSKDINSILQWIVGALYGGYIAANVLKWHWWRFNGNGFFWGMFVGIISAMVLPSVFPATLPLYYFPVILLLSFIGCVVGSLLTPVTDINVLKSFYTNVRPWGFWKPVYKEVIKDNPSFKPNKGFGKDMFNVLIGTIAQTAITALPVFIVLLKPWQGLVSTAVLLICIVILHKTWYQQLPAK